MKIAFVSLPVAGHINPMSVLAAEVQSRGHKVVFLSILDAQARAEAAGLRFLPIGEKSFPLGATYAAEKQLSEMQSEHGLKFTFGLMANITGAIIREVESKLLAEQVDGAVFDTYQPYLELSAMSLGLPYIHVSNAAPFDVSGDMPLCFFDWAPTVSDKDRERNLRGVNFFRELLQPSIDTVKPYAQERDLEIDWSDLTATRSKVAWITQLPAQFDFLSGSSNDQLIHAGPFTNEALRPSIEFPWDKLSSAPLVYVSMGTLQNGVDAVFRKILEAIAPITDLQFVVAMGNKLDRSTFLPVPANVLLVENAPQLALLRRASLCVTHAGLNTVLEALENGVPLVAIPVTNDQPGIASRIRAHEVGDFVRLSELTPDLLRSLIVKVQEEPQYRENAQRIADSIEQVRGVTLAAIKIEEGFSNAIARTRGNG
jgi:zeaxanthin glucosyltransferase